MPCHDLLQLRSRSTSSSAENVFRLSHPVKQFAGSTLSGVLRVLPAVLSLAVAPHAGNTLYVTRHKFSVNAWFHTSHAVSLVWPPGAAHLWQTAAAVLISTTGKQHHGACACQNLRDFQA
jgi:hypothetical protein